MGKAIFEFEAPCSCWSCKLSRYNEMREKMQCVATDIIFDKKCSTGNRASFCPLKITNEAVTTDISAGKAAKISPLMPAT